MIRAGLVVFGIGLGISRPCWGNSQTHAVRLGYSAPSICPARDTVWQMLSRHTQVEPARFDADAVSVELLVTSTDLGYSGQLSVKSPNRSIMRQLSDTNCLALLDALSLVAAIAMDTLHHDEVTPGQPKPLAGKDGPNDRVERAIPIWTMGTVVGLHRDVAPRVLPTLGIYSTYRRRDFGLLGQYFGALVVGRTPMMPYALGAARFTWFAGRMGACPLGSSVYGFTYGACGMVEVGWLRGAGQSAIAPNVTDSLWLAPGVGLSTAVAVGSFELGWLGGMVVPVTRGRYYFAPDETIFRTRSVGLVAELRVGLAIW
ncbi:MAG TPA: hypothetical protein VIV60_20620 [Polyangiaceae bacterium]